MALNQQSGKMKADLPKGHSANGKDSVGYSSMESILNKFGVTIKASVLKLRSEISGIESVKTGQLYEEIMGQGRDDKKQSFAGYYTWFLASEVEGRSVEDLIEHYMELCLVALYIGTSGNLLDRINAPRHSDASDYGLSRYMFANGLQMEDVKVLFFTFVNEDGTLADESICKKVEQEIHTYCKANREDGLKFTAAEYSARSGKRGQNTAKVDRTISVSSDLECDRMIYAAMARKMEIEFARLTDTMTDQLTELSVEIEEDEDV
jgi:hypothetical protein